MAYIDQNIPKRAYETIITDRDITARTRGLGEACAGVPILAIGPGFVVQNANLVRVESSGVSRKP